MQELGHEVSSPDAGNVAKAPVIDFATRRSYLRSSSHLQEQDFDRTNHDMTLKQERPEQEREKKGQGFVTGCDHARDDKR